MQNLSTISESSTLAVATNYGWVQGLIAVSLFGEIYFSFRGIPYAEPPVGKLRFMDPLPLQSWSGVLDATKESHPAWQRESLTGNIIGTEDCLRLNVFSKQINPKKLLPVMVFIHGGAFQEGSSSIESTGPDYLMQKDVVLVTLNSRLGALGFLQVVDINLNIPGNAGLKDHVMALRWVKENIAVFGGDPKNVMLIGFSSGSCAVHYHMLSELSKNLFHKAMLLSGSPLNTRFNVPEHEDKHFYVERLASFVGWNGTGGVSDAVNFLKVANASDIVREQVRIMLPEDKASGIRYSHGPVIEVNHRGSFISKQPRIVARNSWSRNIPVILGSTSDEALILRKSAEAQGSNLLSSMKFENLIPSDIGRSLSPEQSMAIGLIIKNFYFKNENASQEEILDNYVRMETERRYVHGMYRMALSRRSQHGTSPTYVYRFSFDSPTFNHNRVNTCGAHCKGASHADQMSYIFRNKFVRSKNDIDTKELLTITRMTDLMYRFAATNVPSDENEFQWIPIEKQGENDSQIKCLNIGDELKFIDLPEMEGMRLWSSLYKEGHLI